MLTNHSKDRFDCAELKDDFDTVILWENGAFGMPKKIIGINDLKLVFLDKKVTFILKFHSC